MVKRIYTYAKGLLTRYIADTSCEPDFAAEENTLRFAQSGRIRASKDGGGSAGRDTTWTHHVAECDADA